MPSITIRFASDEIWTECRDNNINPDGNGDIGGRVVNSSHVTLFDSASGIAPLPRTYVLISPDLNIKPISRLLTVLRDNRLTSGFSVGESLFYDRVVIVDPDGDFTAADRLRLQDAGVNVDTIPAGTPAEMSDSLKNLVSTG